MYESVFKHDFDFMTSKQQIFEANFVKNFPTQPNQKPLSKNSILFVPDDQILFAKFHLLRVFQAISVIHKSLRYLAFIAHLLM